MMIRRLNILYNAMVIKKCGDKAIGKTMALGSFCANFML